MRNPDFLHRKLVLIPDAENTETQRVEGLSADTDSQRRFNISIARRKLRFRCRTIMTLQDVWNHTKQAIVDYVPNGKDQKLIWESGPKTQSVIRIFQTLRDLGTDGAILFSFGRRVSTFYVMNIPYKEYSAVSGARQGVTNYSSLTRPISR